MSTEAHAEVHSREVDVVMTSRDGMTTAAELEWTTAEPERERERERRKTNAAHGHREGEHDACVQRDEGGTWAPSGAHDASVERRERAWAPKQELERAKARGVKHRRVPRMHPIRREAAHACERGYERREASTNACIDGIERCRWCARNVNAAAVVHRRRKCPSAVRRANMEGGR